MCRDVCIERGVDKWPLVDYDLHLYWYCEE
jgi:hypothetical protein